MCDKIGVRFITQSSVRSVGAQYLLTKTPEFVFGILNLSSARTTRFPIVVWRERHRRRYFIKSTFISLILMLLWSLLFRFDDDVVQEVPVQRCTLTTLRKCFTYKEENFNLKVAIGFG